jgi:hypothetical protein
MPSVDINVNQPKDPSTGPGTITGPTVPTTSTAELEITGSITLSPSNWDSYFWPEGRESVVIREGAVVTLAGGTAPAFNMYTIPYGKSLIIEYNAGDAGVTVSANAVLNGTVGEIIGATNTIDGGGIVFLQGPSAAVKAGTVSGSKWDEPPLAPPDGPVYISGWKIDPDLLDDTTPANRVYVENAIVSGDVDLSGKYLTVLGTLIAEAAVTSFNADATPVIPKFDLNGKQVTIAAIAAGTEITSGAGTAHLTIPATALGATINVQNGKDIYLNVAGAPGSDLDLARVDGAGTLVVASTVKQATITGGSGNVRFVASQGLTFNTAVANTFGNTGLTTFDGPVTFDIGATPTFSGPVRFISTVTLNAFGSVFQKAATFSNLVLPVDITLTSATFNGATTITALSAPAEPIGGILRVEGTGSVSINSFNRGGVTNLTKNGDGTLSFPWFTPAASLTDHFTLAGNGNIILTTAPLLPTPLTPPEAKNLRYSGTGTLTLNAGANIGRADAIQVTNTGHLKVPAGQNIVIGTEGALPFTTGPGITLSAGKYNGPFDITNTTATFDGDVVFGLLPVTDPPTIAEIPYGTFKGTASFDAPIAFTGTAGNVITFDGNVIFKDSVNMDVDKIFTAAKDATLYAGKAIEVAGAPVFKAEGGSLVLAAGGARFTAAASKITVNKDITLKSGELVVVKNTELALTATEAPTLTLNSNAKITLEPDIATPANTAKLSFGPAATGIVLVAGSYNGPLKANDGSIPAIPTVFEGEVIVNANATLPYGTFKGTATFDSFDYPFIPDDEIFTISGEPVFAGDVIFKDHVTITAGEKITAAKNFTLYRDKTIQVGTDPVIVANDGNLVLAIAPIVAPATGLGAEFVAAANTITVGVADIAIGSGHLQVPANRVLGLNAVKATLGSSSKITLNAAAGLSGTGRLMAGHTVITNWTVADAPIVIEPNRISAETAALLVGAANSFIGLNPDELAINTGLEISNVDVQLATAGSISASSGPAATATITLSEGSKISGLNGTGSGSNDIVVGVDGSPYQFATQTNLEVVDGAGGVSNNNYLHQKDAAVGSATLGVTGSGGSQTMTINNTVLATADGK